MISRERRSKAPPISALLPVLAVCGAGLGGCGGSKQASLQANQAPAEASPTSTTAAAKPSHGSKLAAAAAAPANPSANASAPQTHSKPTNSKPSPAAHAGPASAAASKASLTPDQLAITAQNLAQHPELWPVEVTITSPLDFSGGNKVPAGRTVILRKFEGADLNLYDRQLKNWFTAAVDETDVLARARERVKSGEKDPFFGRAVGAALEKADAAKTFSKSDYFLVYQARLGCGRCAMFLPELKTFYDRMKPQHPEFEAVFVSADSSAENMKELAAKETLPGLAVAYDKRLEAADLGSQAQGGELLPLVFLYDRDGKLVARNQPNGGKPSAEDVLATLEKKLGEKK